MLLRKREEELSKLLQKKPPKELQRLQKTKEKMMKISPMLSKSMIA